MKITWSIIKYNFFLYRTYYLVFTIVAGLYIGFVVNSKSFIFDEETTTAAASIILNKMIFLIFWLVSFFDYIFLANKIFFRNIKNNQQQVFLFSKITRKKLFLSNFIFLLLYSFSRMLLFFLLLAISYLIQPRFYLGNMLWMLFNITINAIFIAMLFLLFCLSTFDIFDKQSLVICILGTFLLFATVFANLFISSNNTSKFTFAVFMSYFPLFGLTSSVWIETGAWQQYLNLPISILGIIGLGIVNIKLNQKIEY